MNERKPANMNPFRHAGIEEASQTHSLGQQPSRSESHVSSFTSLPLNTHQGKI